VNFNFKNPANTGSTAANVLSQPQSQATVGSAPAGVTLAVIGNDNDDQEASDKRQNFPPWVTQDVLT
jgi:hypothetical protein